MSFSTETKNELKQIKLNTIYEKESELYAYLQNIASLSIKGKGICQLIIQTEDAATIRRIFKLFKDVFDISPQILTKKWGESKYNIYELKILDSVDTLRILDYYRIMDISFNLEGDKSIILGIIGDKNNIKDYFRGVFLSNGYLTDPKKGYHLEIRVKSEKYAISLIDLAKEMGVTFSYTLRKEQSLIYSKDSENILYFLALIGAYNSVLSIESEKVIKEVRNNVNRRTNCETANLDKTVDSALKQVYCINIIKNNNCFEEMPENLKKLATLRLENEEASLRELGEMFSPLVSRNTINGWFKKIEKIAKEL